MVMDVIWTWGTWEELLLGGAVLRYGTRDWDLVASELRARTVCPCSFTPEMCKAKFEDLQQRYSWCTAWFEELRKKRVEELKKALELSEDSIGSLELRLESLKAEKNKKRDECHVDNGSSGLESNVPIQKLEGFESSNKETLKDGLSAGSFTHETRTDPSLECRAPRLSTEEMKIKPEISQSSEQERISNVEDNLAHIIYEGQGGSLRKRRGKRKRKDCSKNIKEASVGESDFLNSADVASQCKETSTSNNCGEVVKSPGSENHNRSLENDEKEELMGILNSVLENKGASAFSHRLDSQKRGRYKKMIRQHMDFDTVRSRISSQTIKSQVELFRDLLLLTNNALVFYSRSTREYKSAQFLRDVIMKNMRQNFKRFNKVAQPSVRIELPVHNPAVKPRSVRPGNRKIVAKAASGASNGAKKPGKTNSPLSVESLIVNEKEFGRPEKVGRGTADKKSGYPTKGKKRVGTK